MYYSGNQVQPSMIGQVNNDGHTINKLTVKDDEGNNKEVQQPSQYLRGQGPANQLFNRVLNDIGTK